MKDFRRLILFLTISGSVTVIAQDARKITRSEYIDSYKDIAMQKMVKTGIPASITLAQGILESGDGNSRLAVKGNNHFGIKCHDWEGKRIHENDDAKNECFRKYKSAEESYDDHSVFLSTRPRYAFLFEYDPDDYKAWAKGLKEAGYATSPTYAKMLIKVIEDNELYKYDQTVLSQHGIKPREKNHYSTSAVALGRNILYNNRVKYIVAKDGDSFTSLSEELDLLSWQLPRYNDLPVSATLSAGQMVYLQPKRSKADVGNKVHIVKQGETIQSISQVYAMQADKLASRNLIGMNDSLVPGSELLLRNNKKGNNIITQAPKIDLKEEETDEEFKVQFDPD